MDSTDGIKLTKDAQYIFKRREENKRRRDRIQKRDNKFDSFWNLDVGSHYSDGILKPTPYEELYSHCIDHDKYNYKTIVDHHIIGEYIRSFLFRSLIMFFILLNAIVLGLQTMDFFLDSESAQKAFSCIEAIILIVFLVEIGLKLIYDWQLFCKSWWNRLDFLIMIIVMISGSLQLNRYPKFIVVVRVFRAFRSLRTVTVLSSITLVQETIENSIKGMINILMVLLIFTISQACMGVMLFKNEIGENKYFLDALNSWLVIFICITQDGWVGILEEFKTLETKISLPLIIYLCIAVFIGAFIFANLIVAVIVTNLEESLQRERYRNAMIINRLTDEGSNLKPEIYIHSLQDIFSDHPDAYLEQRPMKLPTFKHISAKRLHSYIQLIVHLEQNLLEGYFIKRDLVKIMSVHISLFNQIEKYGPLLKPEIEKGKNIMEHLKATRESYSIDKQDPIERQMLIEELKKMEKPDQ